MNLVNQAEEEIKKLKNQIIVFGNKVDFAKKSDNSGQRIEYTEKLRVAETKLIELEERLKFDISQVGLRGEIDVLRTGNKKLTEIRDKLQNRVDGLTKLEEDFIQNSKVLLNS